MLDVRSLIHLPSNNAEVAETIFTALPLGRRLHRNRLISSRLSLYYLLYKAMNMGLMFAFFLGFDLLYPTESHLWGASYISDFWNGVTWEKNGFFPRVSFNTNSYLSHFEILK